MIKPYIETSQFHVTHRTELGYIGPHDSIWIENRCLTMMLSL